MSRALTAREIEEGVREAVARSSGISSDISQLPGAEDLFLAGMKSHASVNLMLDMEETLDIEFPEALILKSTFTSIDGICAAVKAIMERPTP